MRIIMPMGAAHEPNRDDFEYVFSSVKNSLYHFYLHHGIMKTHINSNKHELIIAYCYLVNKMNNGAQLNDKERELYSGLSALKDYGVSLEIAILEKPTPNRPTPKI